MSGGVLGGGGVKNFKNIFFSPKFQKRQNKKIIICFPIFKWSSGGVGGRSNFFFFFFKISNITKMKKKKNSPKKKFLPNFKKYVGEWWVGTKSRRVKWGESRRAYWGEAVQDLTFRSRMHQQFFEFIFTYMFRKIWNIFWWLGSI